MGVGETMEEVGPSGRHGSAPEVTVEYGQTFGVEGGGLGRKASRDGVNLVEEEKGGRKGFFESARVLRFMKVPLHASDKYLSLMSAEILFID